MRCTDAARLDARPGCAYAGRKPEGRAMDVCKTFAFISDTDEVSPHLIDTIFYEDRWWLVGTWLESRATGDRVPERLVH